MLQRENRDRVKQDRCLDLSRGLLGSGRDNAAALLLEQHNVEAVKVRQRAAHLDGSTLLGPTGLSPLLGNTSLVKELLDGCRASTTGQAGHGELGERQVLKGKRLAGDTGGGRVNDGLQNFMIKWARAQR